MCIIVDTCVASKVLSHAEDPDFAPVQRALGLCGGTASLFLYLGGLLRTEILQIKLVLPILSELDKVGRLQLCDEAELDVAQRAVSENASATSNDAHVIALAKATRAQVVCTTDEALANDLTNPRVVSKPRCSVFKTADHAPLLRKCRCDV